MKIRKALERFFGVEKGHRAEMEGEERKTESIRKQVLDSSDHVGHSKKEQLDIWKERRGSK